MKLLNNETPWQYPCPLCKDKVDLKTDKNFKFYIICNDCGLQMFVRGNKGTARMKEAVLQGIAEEQGRLKFTKGGD